MATTMAIQGGRHRRRACMVDVPSAAFVVPASAGCDPRSRLKTELQAAEDTGTVPNPLIWLAQRYRETLQNAGLTGFDEVMASTSGRCLRVLPDRENWYLPGMYLKKHRARLGLHGSPPRSVLASPPSPGRVEARNALALQSQGIDVMPLMAYGEKLHADGRLESFLLTRNWKDIASCRNSSSDDSPLATHPPRSKLPAPSSLLQAPCSPLPAPRSLLPAPCSPLPAPRSLRPPPCIA